MEEAAGAAADVSWPWAEQVGDGEGSLTPGWGAHGHPEPAGGPGSRAGAADGVERGGPGQRWAAGLLRTGDKRPNLKLSARSRLAGAAAERWARGAGVGEGAAAQVYGEEDRGRSL